jgi:hypothetical protein
VPESGSQSVAVALLAHLRGPATISSGTLASKHLNQPVLEVTLMTPGPPLDAEAADFIRCQLQKGGLGGLAGLACRSTTATRSGGACQLVALTDL